jgi:hypothetical protein
MTQPPTLRPGFTLAADRAAKDGLFAADDHLCGSNRRGHQARNEAGPTLRLVWLCG